MSRIYLNLCEVKNVRVQCSRTQHLNVDVQTLTGDKRDIRLKAYLRQAGTDGIYDKMTRSTNVLLPQYDYIKTSIFIEYAYESTQLILNGQIRLFQREWALKVSELND